MLRPPKHPVSVVVGVHGGLSEPLLQGCMRAVTVGMFWVWTGGLPVGLAWGGGWDGGCLHRLRRLQPLKSEQRAARGWLWCPDSELP